MSRTTTISSSCKDKNIRFISFSSTSEASFWMKVYDIKLKELKLNEGPIPIKGYYSSGNSSTTNNNGISLPMRLRLDHDSINSTRNANNAESSLSIEKENGNESKINNYRNELITCHGELYVYNTIETFKRVDKNKLLSTFYSKMSQENGGSKDNDDPDILINYFLCICFMDLKKHDVIYWFAFPALLLEKTYGNLVYHDAIHGKKLLIGEDNNSSRLLELYKSFNVLRKERLDLFEGCPNYFVVLNYLLEKEDTDDNNKRKSVYCVPLVKYKSLTDEETKNCIFGFVDPSTSMDYPGWPMRNLIAYLSLKLQIEGNVQIISFRPNVIRRIYVDSANDDDTNTVEEGGDVLSNDQSMLFHVNIPPSKFYTKQVIGWEPNLKSKMTPRHISLQTLLSPTHLASQAINLNLNLMKWRLLPSLNTSRLANTKCLLIGAGTLGCNVARTLLGWGVTHITFVDNGVVSHSNPVRQTLFEMADVGKTKAVAAADAVLRIAPVTCKGYDYSIPMPGHPSNDITSQFVNTIDSLVQSHDVIFLLTDTRESRWLPSVLTSTYNKPCINSALGLDSFLVLRQGATPSFGCYFCNDVVAPQNSLKERTIDQQCTVTRPGLAPIAAAYAVELMIMILHHPLKHHAKTIDDEGNDLGAGIPHQIRGSLHSMSMVTPCTSPSFPYCTACSQSVINEYKSNPFDFVRNVCNDTSGQFLEELTGLKDFREKSVCDVSWEDDGDDDEEF